MTVLSNCSTWSLHCGWYVILIKMPTPRVRPTYWRNLDGNWNTLSERSHSDGPYTSTKSSTIAFYIVTSGMFAKELVLSNLGTWSVITNSTWLPRFAVSKWKWMSLNTSFNLADSWNKCMSLLHCPRVTLFLHSWHNSVLLHKNWRTC